MLNGEKCFVPLADQAEVILVYASAPDGLGGVPRRARRHGAHASASASRTWASRRSTPSRSRSTACACRPAPASAATAPNLQPLLDASRVASAALAVGVARAAFDYAREYAKERKAFGVAIAQKQAIAFMLAEHGDRDRRHAAARLGGGLAARSGASRPRARPYLAQQYAADQVLKITDNALQVLGGHGYIRDHLVELFLRNARGFAVFDGLAIV